MSTLVALNTTHSTGSSPFKYSGTCCRSSYTPPRYSGALYRNTSGTKDEPQAVSPKVVSASSRHLRSSDTPHQARQKAVDPSRFRHQTTQAAPAAPKISRYSGTMPSSTSRSRTQPHATTTRIEHASSRQLHSTYTSSTPQDRALVPTRFSPSTPDQNSTELIVYGRASTEIALPRYESDSEDEDIDLETACFEVGMYLHQVEAGAHKIRTYQAALDCHYGQRKELQKTREVLMKAKKSKKITDSEYTTGRDVRRKVYKRTQIEELDETEIDTERPALEESWKTVIAKNEKLILDVIPPLGGAVTSLIAGPAAGLVVGLYLKAGRKVINVIEKRMPLKK